MTIIAKPSQGAGRDHRVDFWRGIALVMIFVNHVPGNLWENFTSRNYGFSDAAELFVFLAGFASAFAYGRAFFAGQRLLAILRAYRRAGTLYLVQLFLSFSALAMMSWGALVFGEGELFRRIEFDVFAAMPMETIIGLVTLTHQFGYVNILPMYCMILLMMPIHLWLASRDPRLMLAGSFGLWLTAYTFGIDIPNFPMEGAWFFNPFSWQFIFAIGLFAGIMTSRGEKALPFHPMLYRMAIAYCLVSFVTTEYALWGWWQNSSLPILLSGFDKTYVSLPRLLHVLALAYLFANVAPSSPFAAIRRENPFALLGRHSLPVFAMGTLMALALQIVKFNAAPNVWFDTLLIGAGVLLLFMLARYLEWWQGFQKHALAKPEARSEQAPAPIAAIGSRQRSTATIRPHLPALASSPDPKLRL